MINRILIRIKVIQILYSFLLVEKKFELESSPSAPTKEKRFAYSLYLDMLVLMVRIAKSIERRKGDFPLADTRFISRLLLCEDLRMRLRTPGNSDFIFDSLVKQMSELVEESGVYKLFIKDRSKESPDGGAALWRDLFNSVLLSSPKLNEAIETLPNFSPKGVERMKDMMEATFVNFMGSQDNVAEVVKALDVSLDKARELYLKLLTLPIDLTDLEERILDDNRHKYLRSEADINPDMRLVENQMVAILRKNPVIQSFIEKSKFSWLNDDPILARGLLKAIKESEVYREYMQLPSTDLHTDAELWRKLLKSVILDNTAFLEALEENSVFWNDDLDNISTFVLKSFRRIAEGDDTTAVLDKFKDEEDARFGEELIRFVYRNKETYRGYIDEALVGGNWDKDRIAFMDIVVLETAIAEIMNFPKIPLKVSVNEYIELAKSYSTAKSGQFVHGILGYVISRLQKEGILHKK